VVEDQQLGEGQRVRAVQVGADRELAEPLLAQVAGAAETEGWLTSNCPAAAWTLPERLTARNARICVKVIAICLSLPVRVVDQHLNPRSILRPKAVCARY
jgi:hypothetical protein